MVENTVNHDGVDTRVYHWPMRSPRYVIQIVHGMAEHAGRYDHVARFFNEHGIAVVAHDHRGHGPGRSASPSIEGYFADSSGWARIIEDIDWVRQHFRHEYPDAPWIMLGHSMGSFAVRDYMTRGYDTLAAAILVGTGTWPLGGDIALALARCLAAQRPKDKAKLLNKLCFAGYNRGYKKRTDFDWLSTDPAVVDAYVADPACGFVPTNQFFKDFLEAFKRIDARPSFAVTPRELPILTVSGAKDPVGGTRGASAVSEKYIAAGVQKVNVLLYPAKRHEILNETNRNNVYSDILYWIESLDDAGSGDVADAPGATDTIDEV